MKNDIPLVNGLGGGMAGMMKIVKMKIKSTAGKLVLHFFLGNFVFIVSEQEKRNIPVTQFLGSVKSFISSN